jgi:hypothetical protein
MILKRSATLIEYIHFPTEAVVTGRLGKQEVFYGGKAFQNITGFP